MRFALEPARPAAFPAQHPRLRYRAFGLEIESDVELLGMPRSRRVERGPSVRLELTSAATVDARFSGPPSEPVWETTIDGHSYRMERGDSGDHRLTWTGGASFLLSADGRSILCAPAVAAAAPWQRLLLDTVLWTASLLRGSELLHASAVLGPRGVFAFLARSGHGKSSIAWELVRRGRPLFCDDILALRHAGGAVRAHPGPPLMTLDARTKPALPARVVADLGAELWTAVPGTSEPARLAAVVLLERRSDLERALVPVEPTALTLLPHSLGFPHLAGRNAARFRLLGDVALGVPVYRLSADLGASPGELADLVEHTLAPGTAS